MINYEIAKRLKDGGYPQRYEPYPGIPEGAINFYRLIIENGEIKYHYVDYIEFFSKKFESIKNNKAKLEYESWIYIPTLLELIEACGDRLLSLDKLAPNGFCARGIRINRLTNEMPESRDVLNIDASNPEGAVAALWLSLNSK